MVLYHGRDRNASARYKNENENTLIAVKTLPLTRSRRRLKSVTFASRRRPRTFGRTAVETVVRGDDIIIINIININNNNNNNTNSFGVYVVLHCGRGVFNCRGWLWSNPLRHPRSRRNIILLLFINQLLYFLPINIVLKTRFWKILTRVLLAERT